LASYAATTVAWQLLRRGEWDEAERATRAEIEQNVTVFQPLADTVLTELAVRRGDPDAAERLADLAALADRTAELQRIAPVFEREVEWALTTGVPMPTAKAERLLAEIHRRDASSSWVSIRVAAWAAVAGIDVDFDQPLSPVHSAMARRDWIAA